MESDWRHFRDLVPRVRDRYIAERITGIRSLLEQPGKSPTECFWEAFEAMEKEADTLRRCLDGHSRSRMFDFLLEMIRSGLLKVEDIEGFSPSLKVTLQGLFKESRRKRSGG